LHPDHYRTYVGFRIWDFEFFLAQEMRVSMPSFAASLVVISVIPGRLKFLAGNAIALLRPGAKIDEPAAIRAERTMRVILPRRFFAASWTFYLARHGIPTSVLAAKFAI
jgi:hypothetical protein